jgi:PAS domain S-box-containing protein
MGRGTRDSGIDIIGEVPWGTHFCQFYQTKEDLMDVLVPYFKAGLENNELCIWITSQPLEVEEAKKDLKKVLPDIEIYLENGQIEIIPYAHGYVKEGIFDPDKVIHGWAEKLDKALAEGYDGVRATGYTSWIEKEGWGDFMEYETKVDCVIGGHRMIALCPYKLEMCSATEIIDVVFNHQFSLIKREGKWARIDNSGRKRAEIAAVRAAEDWEQTFDAVPDLIAILDNEYRIVRANRAMAERLGTNPEKCIGKTCYSAVHETDGPPSACPQRQLLKDGLEHTAEVQEGILGGDFLVSVSPLYDSEGKLIRSVHVARDITERKQAEKALQESEARFRTVFTRAAAGLAIASPEAAFQEVNERFCEITGYNREELLSMSCPELVHPDDREEMAAEVNRLLNGELPSFVRDLRYISAYGRTIWVRVNVSLLYDYEKGNDSQPKLISVIEDITDRKKTEEDLKISHGILEENVKERTAELEETYRALMENEKRLSEAQKMAHIGNWDWDLVTGKCYWSDELYRIFGLNPQELGLSYDRVLQYIRPEDRENVDNAIRKALDGEPYSIDYKIILDGREEFVVHAQGEVIFDEKNTPVAMKGTVQNITEKKEAEEAYLNAVVTRKKEIHHRIKNNLQVISSLLDLQADKFDSREWIKESEVLGAFRESQDRVASIALIHEELHEEGGTDTLNFSPYLEKLVENLFQTYRLGNADISLKMDLEEDVSFDMDIAVPLGLIVNELVSNSFKHAFSGRKAGEVRIELQRETTGTSEGKGCEERDIESSIFDRSSKFTLTVFDNGIGIPETVDIRNSDTLGLQLISILVEQLDGELELKRDNGAEFIIRINVEEN